MVDWSLAATLAKSVAGAPEVEDPPGLAKAADESERLVVQYTGLTPIGPLPPAESVDRAKWVDAMLDSMRSTLDPVMAEQQKELKGALAAPLRLATGAALAAQVGLLSGMLAQRVLGQYDLALLDADRPPRLLLVAPNVTQAARGAQTDPETMLRWVTLHETTHAVQFGAVPWLHEHMAGKLRTLIGSLNTNTSLKDLLKVPSRQDINRLVNTARSGGVAALMLGPARQKTLDEVQAAMSVIEGYAEHVMDAVGIELLPDLPRLRSAMERRRADRGGAWRILEKLLGLDLKLRQYETGKVFCDTVVDTAGIAALNRVWDAPESLPTLAELDRPHDWLARTAA